jgi:hypothetical protein
MLSRIARVALLALLGVMIAAWAVSLAETSQVEPTHDPSVHWLA